MPVSGEVKMPLLLGPCLLSVTFYQCENNMKITKAPTMSVFKRAKLLLGASLFNIKSKFIFIVKKD